MHSSDRKSSGHFDPLILGWVSATQRTLSGQSSYLFDNLKRKMVAVAATTTKTRCLYYTRLSVVCLYVREYFKQKHKRRALYPFSKGYNGDGAGLCDPHQELCNYYLSPLFLILQIICVIVPIGQNAHQVRGLNNTITISPIKVDVSIRL